MGQVYALMLPDDSLLYADRKGRGWRVSDRQPDCGTQGRNLVVFVDGRDVLGLSVSLPAKNEREARRAAPYAIEDEIGEAVETVHVALGAADETPRRIDIVSTPLIQHWITHLSEIGLAEAQLVATHSVFPTGNILVETSQGYLGQIDTRRFALDPQVSADVLISQVGEHTQLAVAGETLARWFPNAEQGPGLGSDEAYLTWLADQAERLDDLLNLRQGAFQYRRPAQLGDLTQWRFAATLLALLGLSWFASLLIETHGLQLRASQLAQINTEFAEAGWPETQGDTALALALVQAERRVGGADFPSVLSVVAVLYESLEDVAGSELRSLRYEQQRGALTAVIAFNSFADADRLERAIESRGLAAQANDARQSGDKIIGDVIIGRGEV